MGQRLLTMKSSVRAFFRAPFSISLPRVFTSSEVFFVNDCARNLARIKYIIKTEQMFYL